MEKPGGLQSTRSQRDTTEQITLLFLPHIKQQDLLYSIGNYIQYLLITYNGKERVEWHQLNGRVFEQAPRDGKAWRAVVHGVAKSQTQLSD